MNEGRLLVRTIHFQVFPVADTWHQEDPKQCRQGEYGCALRLCIAMDCVGLDV